MTKSYAYDREGALNSVEKAQKALGRTYLDVMMLHEQESIHTLRGHDEALRTYIELKEQGVIGQVGVSTHFVECARAVAQMPQVDVLSTLLNMDGFGIVGGDISGMRKAIRLAHQNGKGVSIMKPLGGGHLSNHAKQALDFLLPMEEIHTIALGMQSMEEVVCNLRYFQGNGEDALFEGTRMAPRTLHIADWCVGCGNCIQRCKQKALFMGQDQKVVVQEELCVLCGYCAKVCPEFCMKVY